MKQNFVNFLKPMIEKTPKMKKKTLKNLVRK